MERTRSFNVASRAGTVLLSCAVLVAVAGDGRSAEQVGTNQFRGVIVHETNGKRAQADRELARGIAARLESDPKVASYKIAVRVTNATATLQGKVDTLLEKQWAAVSARTVPGVSGVDNRILLVLPDREDWQVQQDVDAAFFGNPILKTYELPIKVERGHVTLNGAVNSHHRKQLAGALAASVPGVLSVENELRVDQVSRSDLDIRADVLSQLEWDPGLRDPQLRVEVAGRTVTIRGLVESEAARQRVYRDAWVAGVEKVDVAGVTVDPAMSADELSSRVLLPFSD